MASSTRPWMNANARALTPMVVFRVPLTATLTEGLAFVILKFYTRSDATKIRHLTRVNNGKKNNRKIRMENG